MAGAKEQEGGDWCEMRPDSYVPLTGPRNHVWSSVFVHREAMGASKQGADMKYFVFSEGLLCLCQEQT